MVNTGPLTKPHVAGERHLTRDDRRWLTRQFNLAATPWYLRPYIPNPPAGPSGISPRPPQPGTRP